MIGCLKVTCVLDKTIELERRRILHVQCVYGSEYVICKGYETLRHLSTRWLADSNNAKSETWFTVAECTMSLYARCSEMHELCLQRANGRREKAAFTA